MAFGSSADPGAAYTIHGKRISDEHDAVLDGIAVNVLNAVEAALGGSGLCNCGACITHVLMTGVFGVITNSENPADGVKALENITRVCETTLNTAREQAAFDAIADELGAVDPGQERPS